MVGCIPEIGGKNLLLKTLGILVTEHGANTSVSFPLASFHGTKRCMGAMGSHQWAHSAVDPAFYSTDLLLSKVCPQVQAGMMIIGVTCCFNH